MRLYGNRFYLIIYKAETCGFLRNINRYTSHKSRWYVNWFIVYILVLWIWNNNYCFSRLHLSDAMIQCLMSYGPWRFIILGLVLHLDESPVAMYISIDLNCWDYRFDRLLPPKTMVLLITNFSKNVLFHWHWLLL